MFIEDSKPCSTLTSLMLRFTLVLQAYMNKNEAVRNADALILVEKHCKFHEGVSDVFATIYGMKM